ncbi:MAG: amidohydrolase [Saprospiraceae bacterium]|nr:amidohydrolase [Saprospiraceae bacterium]
MFFTACQNDGIKADLIIRNAVIWTGNDENTEAQAMALSGDTIMALGTNADMMQFSGANTEVIDLKGRFVIPGFIDSHVHLISGGRSLLSVDLRDAGTPEEFTGRIAAFAGKLQPNEWIFEANWDHTLWGGALPQKGWIDNFTSKNPVAVFRLDGHMVLANSLALAIAGIDKNTPDVSGGTIVRDKLGNPTGILKDNAINLLTDKIPPMSEKQRLNCFQNAINYFLSNGVTTVHDVDGFNKDFESYSTALHLRNAGELKVRIYSAMPLNEWDRLAKMKRDDDKWLKTGCLKGFVDGSLGSHTAAFQDVYSDKKDDKGLFLNTEDDLYKWISASDRAGLQVFVHAIGDLAIHTLLNIYERVTLENGGRDRRFRIEHTQHLLPSDIKRFAKLKVIASMQPYHCIDDGRWAEEYIGAQRIKTTYAFKSLIEDNAVLSFGSDWSVAPASPVMGIYAAVTRSTLDGKNPNGWVPEQKISVREALKAYTKNAAYASFDENIKGTLETGKLADFVVLNENIFKTEPSQIKNIKVLQTFVGGKMVYENMDK